MSVEELTVEVTNAIQYLKQCTDFVSWKVVTSAFDIVRILNSTLDKPDVQKALAKYLATLNLGNLFAQIWRSLSGYITANDRSLGKYSLITVSALFCSITDISDEVSKEMGESGCLQMMIQDIDKHREHIDADMLTTVLNAVQTCTENISIYRKVDALAIFKRYLDCDDMVTKVRSLRILAHIVDEEESSLLQTTNDGVGFFLSLVEDAVSNEDHREYGIAYTRAAVLELLRGLNKLAINDTNKRVIARLGGIPVFIKMLTNEFSEDEQCAANEFSEDEQCAAVQTLLNMSFIEELRSSEELQKSVKGLEKLAMSSNQHLQQMATYALWQIKGQQLSKPDARQAPPSYAEAMTQPTRSTQPNAQVMISYQWDNQKTTRKLRDLVQAGYQVWMDVTYMRGSLLDAMAKAVETSSLVLVCMSERYKSSENCRAGVEDEIRTIF